MIAVGLLLFSAGSAKAGEYADSLPETVPEYFRILPEYHYGAAAAAAAVTLPALYLAYSGNSYLGLFAAASLPPMFGYAIAEHPGLGFPLARNMTVAGLTFTAFFYYIVTIATGVSAGGPRSEEEEAEDNQTASDILRYGFFALGPLTLLDFIIIALPFENKEQREQREQKEQNRISLNVAPDRAVLVYKF